MADVEHKPQVVASADQRNMNKTRTTVVVMLVLWMAGYSPQWQLRAAVGTASVGLLLGPLLLAMWHSQGLLWRRTTGHARNRVMAKRARSRSPVRTRSESASQEENDDEAVQASAILAGGLW